MLTWSQKRERLGLPPGDTDPDLDDMSSDEYVFIEDPPELVAARERLAQYTSAHSNEEEPRGVNRLLHCVRVLVSVLRPWQVVIGPLCNQKPASTTATQVLLAIHLPA